MKKKVGLMQRNHVKLISMDTIPIEAVKWLLYPFIPLGKITILQGDPGEGKTTLALQIIAALTTGKPVWEGAPPMEPVNVIYQTAEDGLSDTIKPRLVAAGADCARVMVIDDFDRVLTLDDDRLEQAIEQTGAQLVVLDPIQGYIGASVDMHRANEIRPLMYRIAKLAEKYGCAILLIGHMNKNSGEKSSYRGLGSIDFQAAARSVLVVGRIKDDPTLRVVCPAKSSLAPEGGAVAFRLDPEQGFQWAGPYDISVDELLSGSSRGHKLREAQSFLKEVLADGPLPQTEIEAAAQQAGIRPKTLCNARYELGVTSTKISKQWVWACPKHKGRRQDAPIFRNRASCLLDGKMLFQMASYCATAGWQSTSKHGVVISQYQNAFVRVEP